MTIKTIQVGELRTNCYIVSPENSREALIIDPGDEPEKIISYIDSNKLIPKLIVNTHAHPDHVGGNQKIAERYGITAALSRDGFRMIEDFKGYFESFSGLRTEDLAIKRLLNDGDKIKIGGIEFKVLTTPGHSRGSICLFDKDEGILFSGDTLFAGTYGRTDVPGGSEEEMQRSLARLMELPDDTVVYPGHGSPTKIADERGSYV